MPSEPETVTVTLGLNDGTDIGFAEFAKAASHFDRLLKALSRKYAGRDTASGWRLGGLREGSATMTAASECERAAMVADAYLQIGHALRNGGTGSYGKHIHAPVEDLVAMFAAGLYKIRFETRAGEAVIGKDERTSKPVAIPLRAALGAIEGVVDVLSRRRSLHFNLYDSLFDRPVSCYVDPKESDRMRDIWGKRVTVEGLVSRDAEHGYPIAVRSITDIKIVPDAPPGSYKKARGAIPRKPGQPRAEEVIRKMRDAV